MNNEKKIMVFTCVAHFFTHFYEMIFPALAIPLTISLKMSLADVLKMSFFMYLLYGLTALPWGMISDRFNNRITLIIFFIGTSVGAILTAFSDTRTSLMLSLAVIGLFASSYHPAGMGLISLGMKNRGMALGINGVAGNIGMISAPFTAGLLNWLVGWEVTYMIIGALCLIWGITLFMVDIDETPVHAEATENTTNANNNNSTMKYFLILCIIVTIAGLVYRGNSVVLPAYLELKASFLWDFLSGISLPNITGAKTAAATLLASIIYLIGIPGQILGGKLADKYDLRWLYFAFHGLSLPFIILMGVISQELLVLSAGLYIFFALGMQPIENSLVAKYTPKKWRSTGYGIKFILVFGIGSFSVYIVGWIKELWNLNVVYFFAAGLVALLVFFIAVLIRVSRGTTCRNNE
ncbi:MAG TPA: MFS transporter [Syntrophales bacterium]|nr:MFS transporter [Syntrophales bacterium]HPQ42688.1 MFS transporter [Syntrophales bacterium]